MKLPEKLKTIGDKEDKALCPAQVALDLAASHKEGRLTERYYAHLEKIVNDVRSRHSELLEKGAIDDAGARLAALKHIICDQEGYHGEYEDYDNLDNTDFIEVIERRKGLPVALALFYIHVGHALDWNVFALNFPGHVYVRLEYGSERLIFDPFEDCKLVEAHDLRQKLKQVAGETAELSVNYYEPLSNRDVILRLQNNRKTRQIASEDYEGALHTIETTRLVVPREERLVFESGIIHARLGQRKKAIDLLHKYLETSSDPATRHDSLMLLQELESELN